MFLFALILCKQMPLPHLLTATYLPLPPYLPTHLATYLTHPPTSRRRRDASKLSFHHTFHTLASSTIIPFHCLSQSSSQECSADLIVGNDFGRFPHKRDHHHRLVFLLHLLSQSLPITKLMPQTFRELSRLDLALGSFSQAQLPPSS